MVVKLPKGPIYLELEAIVHSDLRQRVCSKCPGPRTRRPWPTAPRRAALHALDSAALKLSLDAPDESLSVDGR